MGTPLARCLPAPPNLGALPDPGGLCNQKHFSGPDGAPTFLLWVFLTLHAACKRLTHAPRAWLTALKIIWEWDFSIKVVNTLKEDFYYPKMVWG